MSNSKTFFRCSLYLKPDWFRCLLIPTVYSVLLGEVRDEIHYIMLGSIVKVVCLAIIKEETTIIHYFPWIHSVFMQLHVCHIYLVPVPWHTVLVSCVCCKNGQDFGQKQWQAVKNTNCSFIGPMFNYSHHIATHNYL